MSKRPAFLEMDFVGIINELWKYLFSLVYIFLAFYVSKCSITSGRGSG
jgi:hypothetical protein